MTPLQIVVGVVATLVLSADGSRKSYVVVNNSMANMWLDNNSNVNAATGFLLAAGQQYGADDDPVALWAIGAVGAQALGVATLP